MRQVDPLVGGGGHAEGVPLFQVRKDLRILVLNKKNFTVVIINFTVVIINFTVVIIILKVVIINLVLKLSFYRCNYRLSVLVINFTVLVINFTVVVILFTIVIII